MAKKKDDFIPDIQIPVPETRDLDEYIPAVNPDCLDLEKISKELVEKRKNSIIPIEPRKETIVANPFTKEDFASDFKSVRDMMVVTNESVKKILKEIPMDGGLLKPTMLMALNSLFKTLNDNGRLLIDMYEKVVNMDKQENYKREKEKETINNNTFIFAGDTNDLNEKIDDILKRTVTRNKNIEEAEVIDEK